MGLGKTLLSALGLSQALYKVSGAVEKNQKWQKAKLASEQSGKPLLVIGGPYGSPTMRILHIPSHPCGDVCLDIDPGACEGCSNITVADIRSIPFSNRYFGAAFASHVLEHLPTVDDATAAVNEMQRVADDIFIVSPHCGDIYAYLLPQHHLWVRQVNEGVWIKPKSFLF